MSDTYQPLANRKLVIDLDAGTVRDAAGREIGLVTSDRADRETVSIGSLSTPTRHCFEGGYALHIDIALHGSVKEPGQ